MSDVSVKLRIDKWLWRARFFKSRTLAAQAVNKRKVRVNRQIVDKSHTTIQLGDVITFVLGQNVLVVEVLELGVRRGPATEARSLYRNLDLPAKIFPSVSTGAREKGRGRPTKSERRAVDRLTKY